MDIKKYKGISNDFSQFCEQHGIEKSQVGYLTGLVASFHEKQLSKLESQLKNIKGNMLHNGFSQAYVDMIVDIPVNVQDKVERDLEHIDAKRIKELEKCLKSVSLSMKAHPDNTEGSEFDDYVSIAEELLAK